MVWKGFKNESGHERMRVAVKSTQKLTLKVSSISHNPSWHPSQNITTSHCRFERTEEDKEMRTEHEMKNENKPYDACYLHDIVYKDAYS